MNWQALGLPSEPVSAFHWQSKNPEIVVKPERIKKTIEEKRLKQKLYQREYRKTDISKATKSSYRARKRAEFLATHQPKENEVIEVYAGMTKEHTERKRAYNAEYMRMKRAAAKVMK